MNCLKNLCYSEKFNAGFIKKLTVTQKLMKLKRKLLIMIMINIFLLKNLIKQCHIILWQDLHKQI